MKDRTPKFPGRVKLKPVAGQTDTYDMTRADDPDDTGTPFNTRTMLQDSTGRFLRLPYANPLVDDAFRHMVDRIVPIGTIRTSPAQSLGDAWLKCDGSQVTFSEYPQLCSVLRNTSGAVAWQSVEVGTPPNFEAMSRAVKFKGKWYVAGGYNLVSGANQKHDYTMNVAVSDTIEGNYTVIHTVHDRGEASSSAAERLWDIPIQIAASENRLCVLYGWYPSDVKYLATTEDGETWVDLEVSFSLPTGEVNGQPIPAGFSTDGTYWAFQTGRQIIYTTEPEASKAWSVNSLIGTGKNFAGRLTFANGLWLICECSDGINLKVRYATTPGGSWSSAILGKMKDIGANVTPVAWFNERYWIVSSNAGVGSSLKSYVSFAYASDMESWVTEEFVCENQASMYGFEYPDLAATDGILVLADVNHKIFTTSDPKVGWVNVNLPAGTAPINLAIDGDKIAASGKDAIAYHDYATETRTLPTISLSSDTTTFIKAKNELDVFEAGG